jgi:hypothetical protein
MARSGWRLLAAFLLILIAALLRGQSAEASRFAAAAAESSRYPPVIGGESPLQFAGAADGMAVASPEARFFPLAPPGRGLQQIAEPAGIIFSGTVLAISSASSKGPKATEITFRVKEAFRGVSAGQRLTIREWAGLRSRGESYRVGEAVLLFLYRPSRLGLTSPVAGGNGRFAVNSAGEILLSPQHIRLFVADPILGGKTVVPYRDFAHALRRAGLE